MSHIYIYIYIACISVETLDWLIAESMCFQYKADMIDYESDIFKRSFVGTAQIKPV